MTFLSCSQQTTTLLRSIPVDISEIYEFASTDCVGHVFGTDFKIASHRSLGARKEQFRDLDMLFEGPTF